MCRKVFLFLNWAVEQNDDGKGREPYLAWNWELADLMENREIYKESGIAYGFYTPLAPPDSKGVLLFKSVENCNQI